MVVALLPGLLPGLLLAAAAPCPPAPCPGKAHAGRTFCPSDPTPGQCEKASHPPCPPCKAPPAPPAGPPPAPGTPPPCVPPYCTPGQSYNYQGCLTRAALAQPYCNTSLSIAARVRSLVASLNLTEKANRMSVNSEGPADDDTYRRLGLPPYAWLMETNTAANAACLNGTRCATNFVGPEGLAASFNRSVWRSKGEVVSTEQRAFSNHGAVKLPHNCQASKKGKGNPCYVSNTGYGPNINVMRSPQFGRNSEMVGEDPLLSGSYAREMVGAQQAEDEHGHPRMMCAPTVTY
jgi:hypothetical protein